MLILIAIPLFFLATFLYTVEQFTPLKMLYAAATFLVTAVLLIELPPPAWLLVVAWFIGLRVFRGHRTAITH